MKTGPTLLFLSLGLSVAAEARASNPVAESNVPASRSAVHGRILELLKQDVAKLPATEKVPATPKETIAPFLYPHSAASNQPVADGVLELEPIVVTKKKPVELPLRIEPINLDNFFYGDGAIFKSANDRFMISLGPGPTGTDAIRFTLKF